LVDHFFPRKILLKAAFNSPDLAVRRDFTSSQPVFYVFRREKSKEIYDYRWMTSRNPSKKSTLGRRLRQARQEAGLAQDKLGVLAGLEESSSSARISRYESGIHAPPLQFVEAAAKVLGLSAAFFYCSDDRLADIIRIYSEASEVKRKRIYQNALEIATE
jgi:transcriptional regulator with XRE-family HTH domain